MSNMVYPPRAGGRIIERSLEAAATGVGASLLPLVCRWPERAAPKGFVVFCHGLSASGRDYAEISSHWASHGYLVVHPTFPDWIGAVARAEPDLDLDPAADLTGWLDEPKVRARMYEILHTPAYGLERIRIVNQVMDAFDVIIEATCGRLPIPISGAIAGHSFGAYTSQLFAGAEIDLPDEGSRSFRDARFAAAILLSAQGRDQQGLRAGSWNTITGPMLNVTGTRDGGAKGQDWHWKTEPYDFAPDGDKYLAVLHDADHYLGGIARPDQSPMPAQKDAVLQVTLAFLDAYIAADAAAKDWLHAVSGSIGACEVMFKRK